MMLSRAARGVATAALRTRVAAPTVRWSSASAATALNKHLQAQMDEMKKAGTFKVERVITSAQAANITVQGRPSAVINLCANNYLGLSNDPELVAEAKHTLDTHGFGLSSVRFICGTQDIHKKLEALISEFHGTEDTILFPSCFDANAAIFEAVLTPEDAIITDSLNHASIIDGIRLCKAQKYIYKHLDLEDMRSKLEEAKTKGSRFRWIVTDGAFSMDGDIAPLDEIKKLADECVSISTIVPRTRRVSVVRWSSGVRARARGVCG
jgi:glycine C-acetyltransferase